MQTPEDEPPPETETIVADSRAKSAVKAVLVFVAHQFIATWGIIISATIFFLFAHDIAALSGQRLSSASHTLTGTPYYPVQIVWALTIGWLLSRRFKHRSMLWVWILPLVFLCYAVTAVPTFFPMLVRASQPHQTPLAHYFGPLCDRCTAQIADHLWVTLPSYTSVFYSLGAFLARKMSENARSTIKIEFSIVLAVGLVLLIGPIIEASQFLLHPKQMQLLFKETPQDWRQGLAISGAALGLICIVTGAFFIYNAFAVWRERLHMPEVTVRT
jgi:hypothetical protein